MNDILRGNEDLITENQALREKIAQMERQLATISQLPGILRNQKQTGEIFRKINGFFLRLGPSFSENIQIITNLCGELTGATFAVYHHLDGDRLLAAGRWNTPADFEYRSGAGSVAAEILLGADSRVAAFNQLTDTPFHQSDPLLSRYAIVTCLGKTVIHNGSPSGVLCCYFTDPCDLTDTHEQVITLAASALANEVSRNQAIRKLRESEERFHSAFKTSPDSININRLSDGLYVDINEGFTRLTGYSREDVIGKTSADINIWDHPADRSRLVDQLMDQGHVTDLEAVFRLKDGSTRTALMSARIFHIQGIPHILSVTRDISELVAARIKAEEINVLKSRLLANLSHEIRTPLNGILGFAELLRDDISDPGQKSMADIIYSSGQRLLNTLNSILDLSVIESGSDPVNRHPVNLNQLAGEVTRQFLPTAEKKGIRLRYIEHPEVVIIPSDENLVQKILTSLVSNALKFTEKGWISVRISLESDNGADFACLHVTDTGIGIRDEHRELIFDEFRQVNEGHARWYDGSGLGLHLARRFAELMGGTILVASKPFEGSTFSLKLPVSE